MFKIEEKNNKFFVMPTADYLLDNFDRFSFPYDSNWEIYKLFNYPPEQFFQYIICQFNAHVTFKPEFPFVSIYFPTEFDAGQFKQELITRAKK